LAINEHSEIGAQELVIGLLRFGSTFSGRRGVLGNEGPAAEFARSKIMQPSLITEAQQEAIACKFTTSARLIITLRKASHWQK